MTLTLYLLRHAEAEPHSLKKDDINRSLTERGMLDTRRSGEYLATQQTISVDYVWCSSAVRTRQTLTALINAYSEASRPSESSAREAALHVRAVGEHGSIQFEKKLYHASASLMLETLQLSPSDAKAVMMVGHNPGISELASALASRGDATLIHDVKLDYPTCALSVFEFHCDSWQEISPANSEIKAFVVPKR